MQDIFLGSVEEFDGQIEIVKIMEIVKGSQENGYDYTECSMLKMGDLQDLCI